MNKHYDKFKIDLKYLFEEVVEEMNAGVDKHPVWPEDAVGRAAIVMEEAGEVIREANHIREGHGDADMLRKELLHTAGTCMRMLLLMNFDLKEK